MRSPFSRASAPAVQPVRLRRAAPCPALCRRCKVISLAVTRLNTRRRDHRLHPVALLPKAREAPEVKTHAGTGDQVQIGGVCHQV